MLFSWFVVGAAKSKCEAARSRLAISASLPHRPERVSASVICG